jgi:hypothetical protein
MLDVMSPEASSVRAASLVESSDRVLTSDSPASTETDPGHDVNSAAAGATRRSTAETTAKSSVSATRSAVPVRRMCIACFGSPCGAQTTSAPQPRSDNDPGPVAGSILLVVGESDGSRQLWPGGAAREAFVFTAVAAVCLDILLILSGDGTVGVGTSFTVWSVLKSLVMVAALLWLFSETREGALIALAALALVVAAEDVLNLTSELGTWLFDALGESAARRGADTQFAGRALIATLVGGPTVLLVLRCRQSLRKACVALAGSFAVLFVVAVGVDSVFDIASQNLDEAFEDPITSLQMAFTVALVVESRRRLNVVRLTRPRTTARRQ